MLRRLPPFRVNVVAFTAFGQLELAMARVSLKDGALAGEIWAYLHKACNGGGWF